MSVSISCVSIAYLLVEWDNDDGHSVIDSKVATVTGGSTYSTGSKVVCKLREGVYGATIICTGS